MRADRAEHLRCPACRAPYLLTVVRRAGDEIEAAVLTCPRCQVAAPLLHGFALLTEQLAGPPADAAATLAELDRRLFGAPEDYGRFLRSKAERAAPFYDLYAAYEPFNESTRSVLPLLPLLREALRPGDLVLDLSCRSGLSGAQLAALLPEQTVLSLWEGDRGALGYRGYRHWLGAAARRPNWEIIFHSPEEALPFCDGGVALVHGLDLLHHRPLRPLLPECLRVLRQGGVACFPHVHLENAEPAPFFERGGTKRRGHVYRDHLRRALAGSGRSAWVLSERSLFAAGAEGIPLRDDADTDHYNGLVLIADARHEGRTLRAEAAELRPGDDLQVLLNPLFHLDLTRGVAAVDEAALGGGAAVLIERHPPYRERLPAAPVALDLSDRQSLYWAQRLLPARAIAARLGRPLEETVARLRRLEALEVLRLLDAGPGMAALHRYQATQRERPLPGQATLGALWRQAVARHGDRPFLIWPEDGSEFRYVDADRVVRAGAAWLRAQGLGPGDRILLQALSRPEFVLLFWAAVTIGVSVVPLGGAPTDLEGLRRWTGARLAVIEADYDDVAEALAAQEPAEPPEGGPGEDDEAVVLLTSGSTGPPKGVRLSHGALYRSARIIAEAYAWRAEDRFLGTGSFHTMSGLRNACVTPLHAGAAVVLPGAAAGRGPLHLLPLCAAQRVSILNTVPAFLTALARAEGRRPRGYRPRLVLSTGAPLRPALRRAVEEALGCPVLDYYGLTETAGACIGVSLHEAAQARGLGRAWDALPALRDGELLLYSENLMLGYLGDAERTAARFLDGWLRTGDRAEILPDGSVVLRGRADRLVALDSGEKLCPEDIEEALLQEPGVAAAHLAHWHEDGGAERLGVLWVRTAGGESMGVAAGLRRRLEVLLPLRAALVEVAALPLGAAGKVDPAAALAVLRQGPR